jgi:aldose 1-epimerase
VADDRELQATVLASSQLQATFVASAGMVCSSLRHAGAELLAQRGGVRAYAQHGSTMGIPLLYPWANRLAGSRYQGSHGDVQLAADNPLLKFEAGGLPIHGAIAGALPWELLDADGEQLRARLRWERPDLLAIFPFAHVLEIHAHIAGPTLTIVTSVHAGSEGSVPVSFGYHPYLTLPDSDRRDWQIELPAKRRLLLDERMIPTGASEPFDRHRFELGDGAWDDAFADLERPAVFGASAGARRVELEFRRGYSHAQVYTPKGESFICFEPMTAPTNALISRDDLPVVEPGGVFEAEFTVNVSAGPGISDASRRAPARPRPARM